MDESNSKHVKGHERGSHDHGTVHKGGGAEETTACGGGDEGELIEGLQGIQGTDKKCLDI